MTAAARGLLTARTSLYRTLRPCRLLCGQPEATYKSTAVLCKECLRRARGLGPRLTTLLFPYWVLPSRKPAVKTPWHKSAEKSAWALSQVEDV